MANWRKVRLGEICRFKYGEMPKKSDLTPEGYPVYSGYRYVGFSSRCHYPESEIIVVARGVGGTGDIKMTPPFCFLTNISIAILLETPEVFKPFLFYRLSATTLWELRTGSAQAQITIEHLKDFEVEFPPLPVQRRIAGILSAYDELMENSQRRIRLLETMARALYREWFVHFRFPGSRAEAGAKADGHEKLPRVASSLGDIPQGWEVCALGDFVQFKSGFAFKSGTFTADGEHRLLTIRNVQDGAFIPDSASRMSELPEKSPPYCVLEDGDILLSLTGNVGRVCLVYDGPFLLNQRVSKLAPAEAFDWAMTYCMFREPEMRVKLEQLSNGVAQQNLSPVLASKMEFAHPPRELRQRFAVLVEPMVRRIVQLYSTIQNLRLTRNMLMTSILSGALSVAAEKVSKST